MSGPSEAEREALTEAIADGRVADSIVKHGRPEHPALLYSVLRRRVRPVRGARSTRCRAHRRRHTSAAVEQERERIAAVGRWPTSGRATSQTTRRGSNGSRVSVSECAGTSRA